MQRRGESIEAASASRDAVRVLHVGNIANNAYLNSRILRGRGIESWVISNDYRHVMGCPEWEDACFREPIDQFEPRWDSVDLAGFVRPEWFVSGPAADCLSKIESAMRPPSEPPVPEKAVIRVSRLAGSVGRWVLAHSPFGRANQAARRMRGHLTRVASQLASSPYVSPAVEAAIAAEGVLPDDYLGYLSVVPSWRRALSHFDVIIGYGTSGVYPMLCGHPRYVAFEHGTIRSIPYEDSPTGRLCKATYRLAGHCIATNADAIHSINRLGLRQYSFVPHPVNESRPSHDGVQSLRARMRAELDADFVVFHPSRQHWEPGIRNPNLEKGNDSFLLGLATARKRLGARVGAVLVRWGASIEASECLLAETGMAGHVKWVDPMPHLPMSEMVLASDAVADQFHLGAFGSLTPKALMLARPVLLHLDASAHHWAFPELPPVINVREPDAVASALADLAANPMHADAVGEAGARWYSRHHSNAVIGDRLLNVIRSLGSAAAPSRPG